MKVVLFVDLDGTLLSSNLKIPPPNVDALNDAARFGAEIVFSTGRPLASAKNLAAQFPAIRYLISSNGGCLADLTLGSAESIASFTDAELDKLLRFASQRGLRPILYTVDGIWADALSAEVYLEISRSGTKPHIVPELPRQGIVKALLIGEPATVKNSFEEIHSDPQSFSNIVVYISYPEYLEMSPKGAGKVAASELLLDRLGLSWSNAVTFGDSANDVEMMMRSAQSVAVDNATSDAKAAATVIAPTNDEAGVAAAIKWLLFQDEGAKSRLQILDRTPHVSASRKPS